MNRVFADTSFLLAIVNRQDALHLRAIELTKTAKWSMVSTAWVMTEVANSLSSSIRRTTFFATLQRFELAPDAVLVPPTDALFRRGVEMYKYRPDKHLSLTDCISFLVMEELGIREALTADHHFEQAGFVALLK